MTKRKTIALVLGTRPEIIKMMPVKKAIDADATHDTLVISTGQQREMSRQAFATFEVIPDVDLDVMLPNQKLPELTSSLVTKISAALAENRPDAVLVHGDTTSALAGALAASYQRIPVGHVEAGLRTYNFEAPWPEEMNRRLIAPLCRWCFAPTELSRSNLLSERIPESVISVTGNTVIDALLETHKRLQSRGLDACGVGSRLGLPNSFVSEFLRTDSPNTLVLVTGHRRESFGVGFEQICRGIRSLVDLHAGIGVIYPVHLNPNVQDPVNRLLGAHERIRLVDPIGYEDFILLMARSHFIITDSGGVQEEAPSLGKPVLVMRTTTERPEGVAAGTCLLVGTDADCILKESQKLLTDPAEYARRSGLKNPYGDGRAAERIAAVMAKDLR
jgi:UDP-N-acetylglucosamine 2-epimerase (non-hydrolysing)